MKTITIYSDSITPRLEYACTIIFKTVLNIKYQLTSNLINLSGALNYSNHVVLNTYQIKPSGLLGAKGVSNHDLEAGNIKSLKTLFHSGEGDLPFDIFSAVFYMCSRYEEYLPFESDIHGRFKAEDSTAYRYGFHQLPIVELWVQYLAEKLKLEFPKNTYKQQLTIDVDNAWMFKHKPLYKTISGQIKVLLAGRVENFKLRRAVVHNKKPDPGFTFDYLKRIEEKLSQQIQYFFLVGNKSPFDNAISLKKKEFKELIISLKENSCVGMHPSYDSNDSFEILQEEFNVLSNLVQYKIQASRQHYLKFSLPNTCRNLIKLGVRYDYTMGWAGKIGFRAGISRPYPFYDLLNEKETDLQLVPFVLMDRTLKDYMNLSPAEALKQIKQLTDTIKAVGGQFCMLWHNESVSDYGEWQGWKEVFEEAIIYAEGEND